jgi:FKBP-type peptidyl-prolyl cis-trans isomerase FkpA
MPAENTPVDAARKLGAQSESAVVSTGSGLQYIDVKEGEGTPAKAGDMAIVHYTGWLVNGRKFDSSLDRGKTFNFPLGAGRVIRGWDEGVAGMKPGGVRKLIVPAELGYGDRGVGPIPPNSTLIFEVQLLEIQYAGQP